MLTFPAGWVILVFTTAVPWKESDRVRGSAQVHDEEFKACVALQAQTIFDRFGKFSGTVPSIFCRVYLQAHHLDLEFYDHHFGPGGICPRMRSIWRAGTRAKRPADRPAPNSDLW